jgi:hypothetical protein
MHQPSTLIVYNMKVSQTKENTNTLLHITDTINVTQKEELHRFHF